MVDQIGQKDWKDLLALLTIRQFHEIIGLSRVVAYQLAHRPGFPVLRLGRSIRIGRDAARHWIEQHSGG